MAKKFYRVTLKSGDKPLIHADNIFMQEESAVLVNDPESENEDFEVVAVFPVNNIERIETE